MCFEIHTSNITAPQTPSGAFAAILSKVMGFRPVAALEANVLTFLPSEVF